MFSLFSINAAHYSVQQRRSLLNSANGRIFHAEWVTKGGRGRKATLKRWQKKSITYWPTVMENSCGHIETLYTAVDINKEKQDPVKSWVNIDLTSLKKVTVNSFTYKF